MEMLLLDMICVVGLYYVGKFTYSLLKERRVLRIKSTKMTIDTFLKVSGQEPRKVYVGARRRLLLRKFEI